MTTIGTSPAAWMSRPKRMPTRACRWFDLRHDEFDADPQALRVVVQRLTGAGLFDLHLGESVNLQHPSNFDTAAAFDMPVFRRLTPGEERTLTALADIDHLPGHQHRARRRRPIVARPASFLVFEQLLVAVRNAGSRSIAPTRSFASRR